MSIIIEAKKLVKEYNLRHNSVKAIDGVDFVVGSGESVSIEGKSGEGKTTLLNMLGALETPTSGEIFFKGKPYSSAPDSVLSEGVRRRMGFVFQSHNLLGAFTAIENVSFPLLISGEGKGEAFKKAEQLLREMELADKLHSYPDELSAGQQQRVAIARALVSEPDVVLADEPTGNLDSKTSSLVADLMFSMRDRKNTALVVATHSRELSERFDRTVVISGGRLADA
ncbi:MAG: ABC transporter ATP-binding protein [Thermodesulfobacteriota bacterium]